MMRKCFTDVWFGSQRIEFAQAPPTVRDCIFSSRDAVASEGVGPMLRKTMVILATAAALTGGSDR